MDEPKRAKRQKRPEKPIDYYRKGPDLAARATETNEVGDARIQGPVFQNLPSDALVEANPYQTENERFVGSLVAKHALPYVYRGAEAAGHVADFVFLAGRFIIEVGNDTRTPAEVDARNRAFHKWAWRVLYIPDYEFRAKDRDERILRMLKANL